MSAFRKYTAAFPGKYIQGEQAITALPGLIQLLGKKGLIIASPTVRNKILPSCRLDESGIDISVEVFGGECCEKELRWLQDILIDRGADILVGMGGGGGITPGLTTIPGIPGGGGIFIIGGGGRLLFCIGYWPGGAGGGGGSYL